MEDLPDTPMEDVPLQRNSISSEMVHSDTVLSAKQGKKKKKKRGKESNALANVDLIQQPIDGTCLVTDSRLAQLDVEVGDCDKIQKTNFSNSSLSNDINIRSRDVVDTNNTFEVNVNQVPEANVNHVTTVVEHDDQVCTNNSSKEISLDAPMANKKRKRKKGRKNLNVLASNDVQHNSLNAPSINNRSLKYDTVQQATSSTGAELGLPVESLKEIHQSAYGSNGEIGCVKGGPVATDLKSSQEADTNSMFKVVESGHQACTGAISISQGLNLGAMHTKLKRKKSRGKNQISQTSNYDLRSLSLVSENPPNNVLIQHPVIDTCLMMDSEEVQHDAKLGQCDNIQKEIHYNSFESNYNNKGIRDIHMKMNAKATLEADTYPIHKVVEDDDLACADDVSGKMVMVPLQLQETKRKKKKKNLNPLISNVIMSNTSLMADSELMQHNVEQGGPQEIHQNECANKDKNCSGKDSSGIIDTKVNEISVSQGKPLGNMQGKKKRKRKRKRKAQAQGKKLNLESKEGVISSTDLSIEQQVKRIGLNIDQNVGTGKMLTGCVRKKLLVLDLNGLLADVVGDKNVKIKADGHVAGKKIFKRPFCEDFLQFCFQRFTVGVWSSRRKENVDTVIKVLMGANKRSKLAFEWNQSHCTRTGFQTIENKEKPLFLKELSKLWKNTKRIFLRKVGYYDKSNTLLLDDSPYKALKNPPYTAIFPTPYQYQDQNDKALGPGGDLRVYLEGLALAEDVQEYVEQNPFGQKPITESDPCWSFYAKVIRSR